MKALSALILLVVAGVALAGDFVTNPSATLPGPKTDLRPLPAGLDANRYLRAEDYNALRAAALDVKAALTPAPVALPTCSSALEGRKRWPTGTGGTSSGQRTRGCLCTSDGNATPAYAWVNITSGAIGSSTSCVP